MQHIAFYAFRTVLDLEATRDAVHALCGALRGQIIVASEGINGMLAGEPADLDAFEQGLCDESVNGGSFKGTVFKRTEAVRQPFRKEGVKVKIKAELAPLGVPEVDPVGRLADIHAADVPPAQWRELIKRDDVVVIDNRNHFEYQVGHFEGAIDPDVRDFRDFADYVRAHADQWKQDGKTVAMYCTGGIRCEKSSAWMQDLGLDVKQLEGGILNYFKEMPDPELDWSGECFIFDDRVTLDTTLAETGKTLADIPGQFPHGYVPPTSAAD